VSALLKHCSGICTAIVKELYTHHQHLSTRSNCFSFRGTMNTYLSSVPFVLTISRPLAFHASVLWSKIHHIAFASI